MRQQDMDMVLTHVPFDDFDVPTKATLQDQFSRPLGHLAAQYLIAIFGHPHKVVLDVINCMRTLAVICHFHLPFIVIPGRLLYLNS